jgi:hypothetical protein
MVIGQPLMKHEAKMTKAISVRWLFLCVVCLWLTMGCAASVTHAPASPTPLVQIPEPQERGWWFVRFRMDRPDEETRWERDLLIAHQVASPLIGVHEGEIELWRFHRRSAEDKTGHQFSFLLFATARVAERINQVVLDDPLVRRMLAEGVIQDVITDAVDHNTHPNVGDTSDPKWSPVMQNTWPYYIMGVSRMWLAMIDQVSREGGLAADATLGEMLEHYAQVDDAINRIWQQEGYHALLHHLNAIYGYKALVFWEKRWQSF